MRRILITGVTGFVGPHLLREFLAASPDTELWGLVRWRSALETLRPFTGRLRLAEGDLHDSSSIHDVLGRIEPDGLVHLASQSSVAGSWTAPTETMETNLLGTIHLLEAARRRAPSCRIVLIGSSEQYGEIHADELPVHEGSPLRPLSPYAVSKVAADLLGFQYQRSYGLPVIRVRPFNHTGPGHSEQFAVSSFCRQFAAISLGRVEPVIRVGNVDVTRDFLDVRDIVRAYRLALELGEPGAAYVVSSGQARSLTSVLELLVQISGVPARIERDPARYRPSDVPGLVGDSSSFRARTGWQPQIDFETTLRDLYQEWRTRLAAEASAA